MMKFLNWLFFGPSQVNNYQNAWLTLREIASATSNRELYAQMIRLEGLYNIGFFGDCNSENLDKAIQEIRSFK
jgi:hypothetical protein